jgi:hypothetical protein
MESVGLQHERLSMHYCSAAEGQKFQKTMVEMAKQITTLGPSPLRKLASPIPTPKPTPDTKKETKKKK